MEESMPLYVKKRKLLFEISAILSEDLNKVFKERHDKKPYSIDELELIKSAALENTLVIVYNDKNNDKCVMILNKRPQFKVSFNFGNE